MSRGLKKIRPIRSQPGWPSYEPPPSSGGRPCAWVRVDCWCGASSGWSRTGRWPQLWAELHHARHVIDDVVGLVFRSRRSGWAFLVALLLVLCFTLPARAESPCPEGVNACAVPGGYFYSATGKARVDAELTRLTRELEARTTERDELRRALLAKPPDPPAPTPAGYLVAAGIGVAVGVAAGVLLGVRLAR